MSKKLTGTFYFKRTVYGNLIGEFTNNESAKITTESASPTGPHTEYEGIYNSTWFDNKSHQSRLTITKNGIKYKLEWEELHEPGYHGEGMIVDGILIGNYKML